VSRTHTFTRTHVCVTFANPHMVCETCRKLATGWHDNIQCGCDAANTNEPCGCPVGATSTCPSWSPVDGCTCAEPHVAN